MAKRRMFNIDLMTSDRFTGIKAAARLLYLSLNLSADDDGMVGNVKKIMKAEGATSAHLRELVGAGYIIQFDSGVVAVTHWHTHNQLRKDRYTPTRYSEEREQLALVRGAYKRLSECTESEPAALHEDKMATQISIEKVSEEKERIIKDNTGQLSEAKRSEVQSREPATDEPFGLCYAELLETATPLLPDIPETKGFTQLLAGEDKVKYNKFLNKLRLYALSEHKGLDIERFIKYNEKRYWRGEGGESVMDNFPKYLAEWQTQKMRFTIPEG